MSKAIKRILSFVLCIVIVFGAIVVGKEGFSTFVNKATAAEYKKGDIIEFGYYPQSEVADGSLISKLNRSINSWKSYNYYSNESMYSDFFLGEMKPSDFMRYADVEYDNNKYRAVKFDYYRPSRTNDPKKITGEYSQQDSNHYYTNQTFWFKYEPLKWKILDPSSGLVICENIIDCQPYNNYITGDSNNNSESIDNNGSVIYWSNSGKTARANDYTKSSIRSWLNNSFYSTAFSTYEKTKITKKTQNNIGYQTSIGIKGYEEYDYPNSSDNVFLLSYKEANSHDLYRNYPKGTAYALSQGLDVRETGLTSFWILRTAYRNSPMVTTAGLACEVCLNAGIRPALYINDFDFFTVKRDNNNFEHNRTPTGGFYKVDNYHISSNEIRNKFYSFATTGEYSTIRDEKEYKTWHGSCFGIAMTMGLAYKGKLPVVNNKTCYYNMPLPYQYTPFLDTITYYQLTQYLSVYTKHEKAFYSSGIGSDFHKISSFFDYLISVIDSCGIAVFGYGQSNTLFRKEMSHALIAYDYNKRDDGSYQIVLYDENGNKRIPMTVSADKTKFEFTDGNDNIIKQNDYTFISCTNCVDYITPESQKKNTRNTLKSNSIGQYTILFSEEDNFILTNNNGKMFSQTDGIIDSDIEIIDIVPIKNESYAEYIVTLEGDPNVLIEANGRTDFAIYNDDAYYRIGSENADSVDIDLGNEVTIKGDNCSYESAFCFNDSRQLYKFSGTQNNETKISFEEDIIDISSNNSLSDIQLQELAYEETIDVLESDSSDNISIVNDGRIYNEGILVYNSNQNEHSTQENIKVSVAMHGTGIGTVSGAGVYSCGNRVTLVAKPKTGSRFVGWYNEYADGKYNTAMALSFWASEYADLTPTCTDLSYDFTIPSNSKVDTVWIHAVFEREGGLHISIKNYTESRTIGYRNSITFTAEYDELPPNSGVYWYIDGKEAWEGDTYQVLRPTNDFTVQVKIKQNVFGKIAESKIETVKVNHGLFARIIGFFKMIFGTLPEITQ